MRATIASGNAALCPGSDGRRHKPLATPDAADGFSYRCVNQGNSKKTCIDFFIASATAFVLFGDGRTFNPDAPYGASRVQIYLDLDQRLGTYYINKSTAYIPPILGSLWHAPIYPGGYFESGPYPHSPKALQVDSIAPGKVKVTVEMYDGFCKYPPFGGPCAAIDADIIFTKQSNGQWTTSASDVDRDNYPSIAIYNQQADGSWQEVWKDAEGHWLNLISIRRTIDKLRERMADALGACQLE